MEEKTDDDSRQAAHAAESDPKRTVESRTASADPSDQPTAASRRRQALLSWLRLIPIVLVVVALVLVTRIFLLGNYDVPSPSMENTILSHSRVLTSRLAPRPFALHRGDVITFRDPDGWLIADGIKPGSRDDTLIKRLIGLPGDRITCSSPTAEVHINGVAIDESSYLAPGSLPCRSQYDITVRSGFVFALGDNRNHSADSLYWYMSGRDKYQGQIPISDVTGVGELVYWPLSHWRGLGRPDSVFAAVPAPSSH